MDNYENKALEELAAVVFEKTASVEDTKAFMKGFVETIIEKQANVLGNIRHSAGQYANQSSFGGESTLKPAGLGTDILTGVAKTLGGGIGSIIVNSAVGVGAGLIGGAMNLHLKVKFAESLTKARKMNKVIEGADKTKVIQFAETIFSFAPHIASDPNLLSTILANAIHGDGLDPMTIKTLTELEGRYVENKSFSPKSFV